MKELKPDTAGNTPEPQVPDNCPRCRSMKKTVCIVRRSPKVSLLGNRGAWNYVSCLPTDYDSWHEAAGDLRFFEIFQETETYGRVAAPSQEAAPKVQEFWDAQAEWSQATFGTDAERDHIGPLKHLAKEALEAQVRPSDPVEIADCLFLVFDAARRSGLTLAELVHTAEKKLEVNKARKWSKPTDDNPVEHVRVAEPAPSPVNYEYKLPSTESGSITAGTQTGKGAGSQRTCNPQSTSGVPAPKVSESDAPSPEEIELNDFLANFDCPCCGFPKCGHEHEAGVKTIFEAEISRLKAICARSMPAPSPATKDTPPKEKLKMTFVDDKVQEHFPLHDYGHHVRAAAELLALECFNGGKRAVVPDVETVSAKVHEQWMKSKLAKGVLSRKSESGEELMVPYSELSEAAKDLDRGSVKAVLDAMIDLGVR